MDNDLFELYQVDQLYDSTLYNALVEYRQAYEVLESYHLPHAAAFREQLKRAIEHVEQELARRRCGGGEAAWPNGAGGASRT